MKNSACTEVRSAKDAKNHLNCCVVYNGQAIRTFKSRSLSQAQCIATCPARVEDPGRAWADKQADRLETWEDMGDLGAIAHKSIGNQTSSSLMEQLFFKFYFPSAKSQENNLKIYPIFSFSYFPCS